MSTELTCVQYCRGTDARLAFWREGLELCSCLDTIPAYNNAYSEYCAYPWAATTIGKLTITELATNFNVTSCVDIFINGVFYHGPYYLNNGSKVFCYFYDNSTDCEEDWIAYKGSCYLFVDRMDNMESHYNSCRSNNSIVVSVGSSDEWSFLTIASNYMKYMKNVNFFIGLYDTQLTFSYMWTDETAVTYRKFLADYPQNIINRCVHFENGFMVNSECSSYKGVVCERPKSSLGCGILTSSLTPKITSSRMSTPLCFETCRADQYKYSATRSTSCFCFNETSNLTSINWESCTVPCPRNKYQNCGGVASNVVFVTADRGQPLREGCRAMILGALLTNVTVKTANGTEVIDCIEYAGVTCPESWLEVEGQCYRFFQETIVDPAAMCSSIGGHLAVYETQDEADNLLAVIQDTPMLAGVSSWIFGLFQHRNMSSKLRYNNGAYVNDSLRLELDNYVTNCFAHAKNDSKIISGVACGKASYICERDAGYKGCYNITSEVQITLANYPDLTLTQCFETCKGAGKTLAGVVGMTACYCIGNETIVKAGADSLCNRTCGFHQNCGALKDYMSVYKLDYKRNASTCEELFNQGVLLSGLYTLGSGLSTWCGMKDSLYLRQQVELWHNNAPSSINFSDYSWNRVGVEDSVFAVDTVKATQASTLWQRCNGLFQPTSIVATLRAASARELITDVLKWNLDYPVSVPAYIGLMDQFYMGLYTWSDGSLFHLSDVNVTEVPATIFSTASLSLYVQITANGSFKGQNGIILEHAVCQRDTSYLGCLKTLTLLADSVYTLKDYSSMSMTLCRQLCQAKPMSHLFISVTDCICYDPQSSPDVMSLFVNSSDALCDVPCPGNKLQKCGGVGYFRHHTFEQDIAETCQVLYDNFVTIPATYKINGSDEHCGIDDLSVKCPPGFIAKERKCYRFYRQSDKNVNTATQVCQAQGSYLASPANQTELNNVLSLLQSFSSFRTAELWMVGYFSTFLNGKFATALGQMISVDDPIVANLNLASKNIMLNITSGTLVGSSATTNLPFICEYSQDVSGCGTVSSTSGMSYLNLTSGMSVQQCVSYCLGLNQNKSYALVRVGDCFCADKLQVQILNNRALCSRSCSGQFMQLCGSTLSNTYSVYDLRQYQPEHTQHSCDDLLGYGVVQPATYLVADSQYVTCFKYSLKSDLILTGASAADILTSAGVNSALSALMNLKKLTYGGWSGSNTSNVFIQFTLPDYFVVEGLVIKGNLFSLTLSTSLDGLLYEPHPDSVVQVNKPSQPLWVALSVPVVARFVKITVLSWSGTSPMASVELVGYPYQMYNFSSSYAGCHSNLTVFSQLPDVSVSSFEECLAFCRDSGYPFIILQPTDVCQCVDTVPPRDFLADDNEKCPAICFGGLPCSSDNIALYSTTALTCPLNKMNNSLMASAPFVALPQNDSFSIMTNVTFTCVKGHELNGTNSTAVTSRCMNFELWRPDITQILCSKVSCGSVPVVANAQIIPNETNTTLYGDTVRYRCTNIAYNFNGTIEVWNMTCNEMKRWQPPAPACQPIKCYDTPVVTNAVSNGSASFYTYSTVVTFTCQEGCFFPSDNSTVKSTQCNLNGSWSYVEPMCERFFCAANPPPIAQSTIIKTTDSTHAVYKCDEETEFSDLMKEKETSCNNVTLLWTEVRDVCRRLRGAETNIWLSLTNTSFVESPVKGSYSYTLIECSVLCMNTPGCSIINYSDNKSNPLNCKLYTGKVNSLTPLHNSNWNVYLVGQMLLN